MVDSYLFDLPDISESGSLESIWTPAERFRAPLCEWDGIVLIPANHAWRDAFRCPATPIRTLCQIGTSVELENLHKKVPILDIKINTLLQLMMERFEKCPINDTLN